MKQMKTIKPPYGLWRRIVFSIVVTALLCIGLFYGLHYYSNRWLTSAVTSDRIERYLVQKQGKSLQTYVDRKQISSSDFHALRDWETRRPIILLEFYSDSRCIYCSVHESDHSRQTLDSNGHEARHAVTIQLADGPVTAVLFSDFTYQTYLTSFMFSLIVSLSVFVLLFLHANRQPIRYICRLNEEVQILEGGNLDYPLTIKSNNEITDLAKSLNLMRISFRQLMENEQNLRQANQQLVSELTHDLRTPLTGILLYLEILRTEQYQSEEERKDYLAKTEDKALQLKQISDHLLTYSRDNSQPTCITTTMKEAFQGTVHSFISDLALYGFTVTSDKTWIFCKVTINSEYINRIANNILSNIIKYADPSQPIQLSTIETPTHCGFSVINACLPADSEVESSNIGIESIRSMAAQMDGSCSVERTDSMFEISLLFPKQ